MKMKKTLSGVIPENEPLITSAQIQAPPAFPAAEQEAHPKMVEEYIRLCETPSDINEHLPILREYASKCATVTEMGVRTGVSTVALAMGRPKYMVSYDVNPAPAPMVKMLQSEILYHFIQKSSLEVVIDATDLLFIDTLHTYAQLLAELTLHASKTKRYIIMHDTVTFGMNGADGESRGLIHAIIDGLNKSEWKCVGDFRNNNGLMIMERIFNS